MKVLKTIAPEVVKRKKPVNISDSYFDEILSHEQTCAIGNTNIYFLENVFLIDDLLIQHSNSLHTFTHVSYQPGRLVNIKKNIQSTLILNKIDKGIWITNDWSFNYFHFTTEVLAKILLTKEYCAQGYTYILPKYLKKYSFIEEILRILQVPYLFINNIKIKQLILTNDVAPIGNFRPQMLLDIRNLMLNRLNIQQQKHKKIYISRAKAKFRKVKNEAALIPILKSNLIDILHLEDLSYPEQVQQLIDCTHVIGIHGAGLTNMLYMNNGCKVLEIRNQNNHQANCYFSMASALDLEYTMLECPPEHNNDLDADIIVDVNQFQQLLATF